MFGHTLSNLCTNTVLIEVSFNSGTKPTFANTMHKNMRSWECGMVWVEHHFQHSSGYATELETPTSIHGCAPKPQMKIFAFLQITNATVNHHTRMSMVHWDLQKKSFFILKLLGFLTICFKYFSLLLVFFTFILFWWYLLQKLSKNV